VYADPVETSPAFGLLTKGEIIKKVNDIELNDDSGLAEALIKYKTGDKIDLLVLREGEDVVVEVELR